MKTPEPTTLDGEYVRLEPLSQAHADEFAAIGADDVSWQYLGPQPLATTADASRWIESMLERQKRAGAVTFSVFDKGTGDLAGSSSYLEISRAHSRLEIGFTWYATRFQRTYVNTATKLLLLGHAFDDLEANRVQFQTDARNEKSRAAIERIGAKFEGILRAHKVYPSGYIRDSALYSIIRAEWPDTRARLESLLGLRAVA